MQVREVGETEKNSYNKLVTHVIQSWEWGEFRKRIGTDLVRLGIFDGKKLESAFQLTFHPVPYLGKTIGYFPKGTMPNKEMVDLLRKFAKEKNAAFIKLEPNVMSDKKQEIRNKLLKLGLVEAKKSLFTKYNFLLDLTKSEEELLSKMHPKTRYNIRVAEKKGVQVYETTKDEDFDIYLKLYFKTTRRQGYFGHTEQYHRNAWETLKEAKMARLLIAKYMEKPLVAWMLLNFGDTLYYPYGGSSTEYRDVMASNLIAWEAIKLGKKMGLKRFDMWGALGPDADERDPWYGFHRFKAGYGGELVEYVGTYDLVLSQNLYMLINAADKVRWAFLKALRR